MLATANAHPTRAKAVSQTVPGIVSQHRRVTLWLRVLATQPVTPHVPVLARMLATILITLASLAGVLIAQQRIATLPPSTAFESPVTGDRASAARAQPSSNLK